MMSTTQQRGLNELSIAGMQVFAKPRLQIAPYPSLTYSSLYTLIDTPTFLSDADRLWNEEERLEFLKWLANNPDAGDVIPGSGGCRKVRWSRAGSGKRGGVRVIYFTRLRIEEIWLLLIYTKSAQDNIPGHLLKAIREEIESG